MNLGGVLQGRGRYGRGADLRSSADTLRSVPEQRPRNPPSMSLRGPTKEGCGNLAGGPNPLLRRIGVLANTD